LANPRKLKVAIIGSGNIGTDLLMKILRSELLECSIFIGRNLSSPGMTKANSHNVPISDQGIDAILSNPKVCDLVFDATTAASHNIHAPIFRELGIKAIDMTPSQFGKICVPAINGKDCLKYDNINMITCGGQASTPLAYTLMKHVPDIEYIETVSSIASRSAGPGTRANIDEYIDNTEKGISDLTGCKKVKAILNLNPAIPCIDMQTTVFAKVKDCDAKKLEAPIREMEERIQKYVPGYKIVVPPVFENGRIMVMVRVQGLGDYLPKYAGNLDIINCAAISMAEEYAKLSLGVN
jgi:acetaldehyde dehydrogenase (acetylating)